MMSLSVSIGRVEEVDECILTLVVCVIRRVKHNV